MTSSTAELEDLIDSTVSIPTIPTVLGEITRVFQSPDGSAKEAASVIEKDPAIATRVLRLANSAFYGLRNPVSSIGLACSFLGLKVIKNVVVQATVLQTFGSGPEVQEFDVRWLWDHSFKTAVACRLLAEKSTLGNGLRKDDAYTCGLIHDVGKMILLDAQTDRFAEALRLARSKQITLAAAEGETFGFNHAHVGGVLAGRWKLAEPVQAAVMHHHAAPDDRGGTPHGFLVKAANTLAHLAADGTDGGYRGDLCRGDTLQALGLPQDELAAIVAQVRQARMDG